MRPTSATITVELTAEQHAKLRALAQASGMTMAECVRRFINTCQPGGGGWKPPCPPVHGGK
jgi:hypothetical protein